MDLSTLFPARTATAAAVLSQISATLRPGQSVLPHDLVLADAERNELRLCIVALVRRTPTEPNSSCEFPLLLALTAASCLAPDHRGARWLQWALRETGDLSLPVRLGLDEWPDPLI
jgi:hypothetical protein